jgi:hypothetical protein
MDQTTFSETKQVMLADDVDTNQTYAVSFSLNS